MSLIEEILTKHPEIERNTQARASTLVALLGEGGLMVPLAEAAVVDISEPGKIKKFYEEFIQHAEESQGLDHPTAIKWANKIIGYASVVAGEKRKAWFDTLEDISHPFLGRKIIKNQRRIITGLEVTLQDPILSERFETYLSESSFNFLLGEISYKRNEKNPAKFDLSFTGHASESEQYIMSLLGTLTGIRIKIKEEIGKDMDYSFKWTAKELGKKPGDIQAYWEEKLHYIRLGNSWFRRGLKKIHTTTDAWIEEAYIGKYGANCMDGTPAPSGLHLTFNLDKELVGRGVGTMTGWSFLGEQIQDYLQACNVKNPEELLGRHVRIYEIGMQTVGMEACKPH